VFHHAVAEARRAVSYQYGFSADIAAEHTIAACPEPRSQGVPVLHGGGKAGYFESIKAALDQWDHDKQAMRPSTPTRDGCLASLSAVVEIVDNAVYTDR